MIKALQSVKRTHLKPYQKQFNWLATWLFFDPDVFIIPKTSIDCVMVDGLKYRYDGCSDGIKRMNDPFFRGIQRNDIALDIGANIGDAAIPLSQLCSKVIAVEPLYTAKLKDNVYINEIKNVVILPRAVALHSGVEVAIAFQGKTVTAKSVTFPELLNYAGGHVDFLHCDAEGAEWVIPKDLCVGIREIRFEFHIWRRRYEATLEQYHNWLEWFTRNDYAVEIERSTLASTVDFKELWNVAAHKRYL